MKKTISLFLVGALLSLVCINAQKMELKSGSLDFLKDQKVITAHFDYSDLGVGKYDKEEDYITKKVADYNKDEAGKGDKWKEAWFNDRPGRYEPKFELLFNENMAARDLKCDRSGTDAKFTMILHTTFIEPGFNVGVTRKPAYINVDVIFKETASGKDLAVLSVQNCPGRDAMGFDYDTGYRIEEAYAKLGKSVAAFINKNLK
jgi:hypothetical protein